MDGYREKYGMLWPEALPDPLIDLKVWKHWREPEYKACTEKEPWECFWRAIYSLIPRKEFVRHEWSSQHVYDWTTERFIITWGCASASKSNDYGLLTLIDWMVDPNETVAIMASTSLQMLKLRSYESVLRYFHVVKANRQFDMPGKLRKTDSAIILDDDDDIGASTDKASIRGVAVAEGTEQEARAKLQGAHLPYVRLILDELSQMRPAAMRVRTNLSIGSKDFKLVGLCNPDSFTDLAAQYSKPDLPGGFAAIDPETTHEWSSPYGKVRRHDGLLSPAILHPERKDLGFLLTQENLRMAQTVFMTRDRDMARREENIAALGERLAAPLLGAQVGSGLYLALVACVPDPLGPEFAGKLRGVAFGQPANFFRRFFPVRLEGDVQAYVRLAVEPLGG